MGLGLRQKQPSIFLRYLFYLVLLGVMLSCAGRQVDLVEETNLQKELPKEVMEKFEIKEAEVKSTPEPEKEKKISKKEKKVSHKKTDKEVAPPKRRIANEPSWVGEIQTLEMTYFGVVGGEIEMEVLPFKSINNRNVYHLQARATSSKLFSLFYKLDDRVDSFWDFEGLFSHRFNMILNESKQTRNTLELYDFEKNTVYYWDRWDHWKKGFNEEKFTQEIPPFTQDSMSSYYYVRTLPLETGKTYRFPIVTNGKKYEAVVDVVRRETIYNKALGGEVKSIVLSPDMKFEGVLKKKGENLLWITDDERRFIIQMEAKVKIGLVKATLIKLEKGHAPH